MSLDRVLKDPRLVTVEHNGEKLHFWHHRRMYDIAKNHGYDPDNAESEDSIFQVAEDVMRYLWMCHLAFEPDMPFEEFDIMFLPADYAKLGKVAAEISEKQIPKVEANEEPKKAKGQSKKK